MFISQKRNCNRCIAYRETSTQGPAAEICPLGYAIKQEAFDPYGFTKIGIPIEPCPKPLNYSDYLFAQKWYRRRRRKDQEHNAVISCWPVKAAIAASVIPVGLIKVLCHYKYL